MGRGGQDSRHRRDSGRSAADCRGHVNVGEMAVLWGRYDEAGRLLTKTLELAETHEYIRVRDAAWATWAHLAWLTGAWDGLDGMAAALADDEDILKRARLEAALFAGCWLRPMAP